MSDIMVRVRIIILVFLLGPFTSAFGSCPVGYPEPATSAYVLPYPVGAVYRVRQGNCNEANSHNTRHGLDLRFAYDFEMPIGSPIVASREGTVHFVMVDFSDDQNGAGQANVIVIRHSDGTFASYGHLTKGGSLVRPGQYVKQGEPIGRSGNSGVSQGPHLHFDVVSCPGRDSVSSPRCKSIPVTFRNTRPHPNGLVGDRYSRPGFGELYRAEPFKSND